MDAKRAAAIVVGHGSIHSDGGKSMIRIAARLREQTNIPIVEAGFLNYNQPTLADAVEKATAQGAIHFVIQPYFLIDGQYASRDLPALVQTVASTKPACTFTIGETLGYHAALVKLVQKRVLTVDADSTAQRVLAVDANSTAQRVLAVDANSTAQRVLAVDADSTAQRVLAVDSTARRALLLVAHGTPIESANAPIYRIADEIGNVLGYQAATVAFLDCNQPSIPAAIAQLVAAGYQRIVIQPYFLHLGRHVRSDLPAIFARMQQDYPAVEMIAAHHLDYDPLLVDVAADRIQSAFCC